MCIRDSLDAAHLLEVRKLRDLHAVEPDLPAKAPGAERRALPVVLDKADVMVVGVQANGGKRPQVELLGVDRRGLDKHLELIVDVYKRQIPTPFPTGVCG